MMLSSMIGNNDSVEKLSKQFEREEQKHLWLFRSGEFEGFYGKPWTMDIRREVIQYLGDHGFNTYIYAPKDDELHRKRWREQYDENFFKEFSILVQEAESRGISIVFAVSPGLNIAYSSNSDVNTMVEKLMRLADAGVRSFGLL